MRQFSEILGLRPSKENVSGEGEERRTMLLLSGSYHPGADLPEDAFLSAEGRHLPRKGWTLTHLRNLILWRHSWAPDVILQIDTEQNEDSRIAAMSEVCLPFYIRAIEQGGLPLHAALVGRNGEAVALAAPGGTGKSTCARRIPKPWKALGDDLALITRRNSSSAEFLAHSFPTWSDFFFRRGGGAWTVEDNLPLGAVFFLSQSKEDNLLPMGQGEAAINLSQSGHQILFVLMRNLPLSDVRRIRAKLFDNACRLARSLPVFRLKFTLTGSFWDEIERAL